MQRYKTSRIVNIVLHNFEELKNSQAKFQLPVVLKSIDWKGKTSHRPDNITTSSRFI